MEIETIRKQFPQLEEKVYGKPLVYLDNAATALRPQTVIDKWTEMSAKFNSNIHRAVHYMSSKATDEYENARNEVAEFIGAESHKQIIFTSGTTASINLVAYSFGEAFINKGDEIIVSEAEHHSDIVPWQLMCKRKGAKLKVFHVENNGELNTKELDTLITDKTKLLCVTHISNVLGIVNPIYEIIRKAHERGVRVLVDGAQGIVHNSLNVNELDCDFYAFSGHKMYAATGTGVLYAKKELLDAMPPYMGGGEMVGTVTWEETTYAPVPHKFEAGTQNIAAVPTLVPAIEICRRMREDETEQRAITEYITEKLTGDSRITLYGNPKNIENKIPLFSFSVEHTHHEDLALILDKMGVAVRSGQMCAEPLMTKFGVTGMLRASFAPYNTMQEAEYFIKSLNRAIEMLA